MINSKGRKAEINSIKERTDGTSRQQIARNQNKLTISVVNLNVNTGRLNTPRTKITILNFKK